MTVTCPIFYSKLTQILLVNISSYGHSTVSILLNDRHQRNRQGYRNSFSIQNALFFPRIHETLEINNNVKESGIMLCLALWPCRWTFTVQHTIYVKCEYFMNQEG